MATAELVFGELSGGGGAKTGTIEDTTAASQTITINTGLASVKRFVLIGKISSTTWTPRYRQVVEYDADVDPDLYYAAVIYSGDALGGVGNLGSRPSGSYSGYVFKLSISGGTVTLESPSVNTNYAICDNLHWYAE